MNVAVNPAVPGLEDPVPPQYVQGVWLLRDAPFGPDARALNPVGGANETCDGAANSARRQSRLTDAVGNALGTDNTLSSQVDYDVKVDAVPQFAEKLRSLIAKAEASRHEGGTSRLLIFGFKDRAETLTTYKKWVESVCDLVDLAAQELYGGFTVKMAFLFPQYRPDSLLQSWLGNIVESDEDRLPPAEWDRFLVQARDVAAMRIRAFHFSQLMMHAFTIASYGKFREVAVARVNDEDSFAGYAIAKDWQKLLKDTRSTAVQLFKDLGEMKLTGLSNSTVVLTEVLQKITELRNIPGSNELYTDRLLVQKVVDVVRSNPHWQIAIQNRTDELEASSSVSMVISSLNAIYTQNIDQWKMIDALKIAADKKTLNSFQTREKKANGRKKAPPKKFPKKKPKDAKPKDAKVDDSWKIIREVLGWVVAFRSNKLTFAVTDPISHMGRPRKPKNRNKI